MIYPELVSLDTASGNPYLNHSVAGATYSAAPAAVTAGFRIRNQRGHMYDAIEFVYSYDATADATTTATVRPWFFVPDHDPSGAGGEWLAGKLIETIVEAEFSTDVNAPLKRINAIPNAATRLYLQVVSIAGTAPTNLYMTVYGLTGSVADVAGDGGAGGGGSSTVVNNSFDGTGISTYQSPEDFTATYNNATTLDLTELPFPPVIEQFRQVVVFDTDSNVKATYDVEPPEDWTWTPGADQSTGTLQITGANFGATDYFVVVIRGPIKSYLELMADMAGSGVHQSPRDFTAAYNNATTLDITGMDFDPALAQIRGVVEQATDGRVTMTYHPRNYEFTWTAGVAGAGQLEIANASFQATSAFIVFIEGTERGTKEAQIATTVTTRVWPAQHVDQDGNVQPAGDDNARGIWHRLGNGTVEALLSAASTARLVGDIVLSTQHLDETGAVLKSLATAAQAGFVQLTDAASNAFALKQADTAPTTSTIVAPTQHVGENGSALPSGASSADPIYTEAVAQLLTKATHYSPVDFSVAYTSDVTVTASGAPLTIDDVDCLVLYIMYKPSGGEWQQPLVNGVDGVSITASSDVITVAGAGTPFASGDTYSVGLIYQKKAYSAPEDANQAYTVNPEWARQTTFNLLDLENIATNTTDYGYFSLEGYRYGTLLGITSGTAPTDVLTVTVEATTQTGSDITALTYVDVTSDLFGVASWVDSDFVAITDSPVTFTYMRVKYETSNDSGDDCDLQVDVKLSW